LGKHAAALQTARLWETPLRSYLDSAPELIYSEHDYRPRRRVCVAVVFPVCVSSFLLLNWVRLKRLANYDRFRRAFLCAPSPLSVLCVEAVDVDFHSRPATRDSRPIHQSTPPKSHTSPQPPTNKPDINFPKVSHCPYPICYPKNRDRVQTNPGPLTVSGN